MPNPFRESGSHLSWDRYEKIEMPMQDPFRSYPFRLESEGRSIRVLSVGGDGLRVVRSFPSPSLSIRSHDEATHTRIDGLPLRRRNPTGRERGLARHFLARTRPRERKGSSLRGCVCSSSSTPPPSRGPWIPPHNLVEGEKPSFPRKGVGVGVLGCICPCWTW